MDLNVQSSPWLAGQPRKPPAWVRHLKTLPREIVHQILNDLPIIKVLQILSYRIQHLEDSIVSHLHYRRIFNSTRDVALLTGYFVLYRETRWFTHQAMSDAGCILSRNPALSPPSRWTRPATVGLDDIREYLVHSISDFLNLGPFDIALLEKFSSEPIPIVSQLQNNHIDAFWPRWTWIKETKLKMNAEKARQVTISANLIAEYPGKLKLKKPLDPSQDGPRKNFRHIESCLRLRAKKALKDRKLSHVFVRCHKGADLIELVPYDSHLEFYLNMLDKYPHEKPRLKDEDIDSRMKSVSLDGGPAATYPDEILKCIYTVMDGINYLYTPQLVPRINYNQSSTPPMIPTFNIPTKPHSSTLPEHLHRCRAGKVMCYDEREYEWLKAFLKVVTWMEENLEAPIKDNQKV